MPKRRSLLLCDIYTSYASPGPNLLELMLSDGTPACAILGALGMITAVSRNTRLETSICSTSS